MQVYNVKRFSSYYSPRKYENSDRSEYEDQIDSARRGKENQELDEEAERIRWRSSLKKHDSKKGKTAAILGGPGGLAGKWVGERVAEAADEGGKTDDEIKSAGNIAGTLAGLGAGIGAGYAIKRGIGDSAQETINAAKKELAHFENYRHDNAKYTKMSAQEKKNLNESMRRQQHIIKANQRKASMGKYAMPVLGIVGAVGAAKAISSSLDDRLSRRKAIDSENRRKAEIRDDLAAIGDGIKKGVASVGKSISRGVKRLTNKKKKDHNTHEED